MQSEWVQSSTMQWFLKICVVAKKNSEDFDDRCIRLIELFVVYPVSEVLHAIIAGQMHGVAGYMQRQSFIFEMEC